MVHGIGAPQMSLAKIAVSIPAMNNDARCTPRLLIEGSWKKKKRKVFLEDKIEYSSFFPSIL